WWVRAGGSELSVDVFERDALGDHHHLHVIEQLADLHGGVLIGLVLAGHPHLGGLFDDLLADLMDPAIEFADGARPLRSGTGLLSQLGEQCLEILHADRIRVPAGGPFRGPPAGRRVTPCAPWDRDGRSPPSPAPPPPGGGCAHPTRRRTPSG